MLHRTELHVSGVRMFMGWVFWLAGCSLGGVYFPEMGSNRLEWDGATAPPTDTAPPDSGAGTDTSATDSGDSGDTGSTAGVITEYPAGGAPCDAGDASRPIEVQITNGDAVEYEIHAIQFDCTTVPAFTVGGYSSTTHSLPAGSAHRVFLVGAPIADFVVGDAPGEYVIP